MLLVIDCFLYFHLNDYILNKLAINYSSVWLYYFSVEYCILHWIAPQQGRVVPLYTWADVWCKYKGDSNLTTPLNKFYRMSIEILVPCLSGARSSRCPFKFIPIFFIIWQIYNYIPIIQFFSTFYKLSRNTSSSLFIIHWRRIFLSQYNRPIDINAKLLSLCFFSPTCVMSSSSQ